MIFSKQKLICFFSLLIVITSCRRAHPAATICTTTLYGFNSGYYIDSTSTFPDTSIVGTVDPTTFAITGSSAFLFPAYNIGAYDSKDSGYYLFPVDYTGTAYGQIEKFWSGHITYLSGPATKVGGLVYNKVNNTFYCLDNTSIAIAEVTLEDTSYTISDLVRTKHGFDLQWVGNTATVDESTGAIYFVTGQNDSGYIEEYVPGATATKVIAAVYFADKVLGLCFNKNDNMLYAVRESVHGAVTFDLIKIDPATAAVTTLSTIPFAVNFQNCTAALDPCSNVYIFSTDRAGGGQSDTSDVGKFNMQGVMIQHVVVPGTLEGFIETN
jgi:hypothetical protein